MLSEEALIIVAAFAACGLLLLGILELLWPTRPKHPVRRPPAPAVRAGQRSTRPRARSRHALPPGRSPYVLPPPVPDPPAVVPLVAATPAAVAVPVPVPPAPAPAPAAPPAAGSAVEACFDLYQQRRYADVVAVGGAALAAEAGVPRPADAHETAALWSVVALARQALGDDGGERAALEAAIAAAPAADRATYERQLAALALHVAEGLLAHAQRHPSPDAEERVTAIRDAVAWLDQGQAAAPGDRALGELSATARTMLWPAYEQVVFGLVQRRDFRAARRLLREALADPRFPSGRADRFRELFSGTFSGEIGQLTAQALRSMHDAREADALASLQRAEDLLATLPDESLPPARREEVDQRLWWGYNKLGVRRLEAGEFEEALEPLFHALRVGAGPERREETRALLVRALEGVADTRALAIRELAEGGDREAALVQSDKLWALLRTAMEDGLRQADLSVAFAKVQRLFESLGRKP